MLIQAALYGVLLPGVVTAVLLVALVRPWRSQASALGPLVLGPAIALGHIAGYWGLLGAPELYPRDIVFWLPHITVLGAVACMAESKLTIGVGRWAVRVAVAVIAAWLLLRPLTPHTFTTGKLVLVIGLCAAVLVAYWHMFVLAVTDEHRLIGAGVAIIAVGSVAAAVAASGTAVIGQLTGATAAALGAVFAGLLVFARAPRIEHAAGVVAVATWAGGMLGYFYAELRIEVAIMLAVLPLALWLVRLAVSSRVSRRVAVAVTLVVAVVIAAGAIGRAATADAADDSSDSDYGYGYEYE